MDCAAQKTGAVLAGVKAAPKRGVRKEVLLFAADLAALSSAAWLALFLRFGLAIPIEHALPYLTFLPVLLLIGIVCASYFGLYDFRRRLRAADHIFGASGAAFFAVAGGYMFLAFVQLYYAPRTDLSRLSRLVSLVDLGLLFGWFATSRVAMLAWLHRTNRGMRVALVGPEDRCLKLEAEMRKYAPRLLEVVGSVAVRTEDEGMASPHAELESLLIARDIDQIILVQFDWRQDTLHGLLTACSRHDAEVFLYPGLDVATLAQANVMSLAGLPLVALTPAAGLYTAGKRLIDILVAAAGLVLAVPLSAPIVLAQKLTSKGPVFFVQQRIGKGRRAFNVYKFRTMIDDAESLSGPVLAQRDDPRVTPLGRFLRNFRLDEIPQFANVLKGEMSLIGPRPERPEFVERFLAENPLYERRFLVKPGLTGLAQTHGRYDTDYKDKLRYDLIYINTVSFALDLRILFSTLRTLITSKGAA